MDRERELTEHPGWAAPPCHTVSAERSGGYWIRHGEAPLAPDQFGTRCPMDPERGHLLKAPSGLGSILFYFVKASLAVISAQGPLTQTAHPGAGSPELLPSLFLATEQPL